MPRYGFERIFHYSSIFTVVAACACGPLLPSESEDSGSGGADDPTSTGADDGQTSGVEGSTGVDGGTADTSTEDTGVEDTGVEDTSTGEPAAVCGNGIVEQDEPCDDGNDADLDGCQSDCTITPGAQAVVVGGMHTCALTWGQTVHCWGRNDYGQLGLGHTENIGDDEPASDGGPVDVGAPVVALAAGTYHTCALVDGGAVRCWGVHWGQLGYPGLDDVGDDETPAEVGDVDVGGPVASLFAGVFHTCALLETGGLRCWGTGMDHPLGYPDVTEVGYDISPAEAGDVPVPEPVVDVALGYRHTCVVGESGTTYCWGENWSNVLSVPMFEPWLAPDASQSVIVDVGTDAISVAAGEMNGAVLTAEQNIRSWGYWELDGHDWGNLQVGEDISPAAAGDVDFGEPVLEVQLGESGGCARGHSGIKCWGTPMGYPEASYLEDDSPQDLGVLDIGAEVIALAPTDAVAFHRCAVTATFGVRCWGYGSYGQLGHGTVDVIGDVHPPAFYGDVPFQ